MLIDELTADTLADALADVIVELASVRHMPCIYRGLGKETGMAAKRAPARPLGRFLGQFLGQSLGRFLGRLRRPHAPAIESAFSQNAAPLLAFGLLLGLPLAGPDAAEPETAALEVEIAGFESADGELAIALFDTAEGYSTQTDAVRKAYLPIENGKSRWVLEDLPVGEYALIAYHDENGNRQIDMRIFGMPKEPVGVSNDARGLFGPPKFEAAKFELNAPLTRHALELR